MDWLYLFLFVCNNMVLGLVEYTILADMLDDAFIPMPGDFKDSTKMNWAGCITCYILLFIAFPAFNIGKVVYWLFHIHRTEVNKNE